MNKDLVLKIQNMIDDFMSDTASDCKITSEGYPHGSYVESLGTSESDLVYLIDEINHKLGNPVSLSEVVFDTPSFYSCAHHLINDTKSPLDLKLHKLSISKLTSQHGIKLTETIWKHNSGKLIQIIFDDETLNTISVNEVYEKVINKEKTYVLKGTK